ncbi:MAG: Methylase involved in ubiquinone/menaquinone biosynthesis [Candidatus Magasanikbacteria bacterium GW2011_GWA2_56_11]|uniref:Methylase involved in ubiquinone/menaquinone biosynthesis n=1 Tax=Candidatus Magasanikbacteria bacterium GW2011_GWA2_56_11 TaxID=1619044 RepID=A0A0G1YG01_9BACT|nr:MAG: Methylase involved in ubiquinone/menaquinone biosynthesis [Candidatus Magasanikbacteria bacterium GW2011_GWA2_56_11]
MNSQYRMQNFFLNKWSAIRNSSAGLPEDEKSLYVPPGAKPLTQRQLNLYYYFIFIKEIARKHQVKKSLEIGCGRGTMSLFLATYLGTQTTLLDQEPDAIALARQEFVRHGAAAEYHVADALDTGLPAESFDAVVSIGLAEHIDNVEKLLAEEYRLLKPGGVMISLNIPRKFSVQYLNRGYRFLKKALGKYTDKVNRDYYRNALQAADYARIARQVGFERVEITPTAPYPIYTPMSPKNDRRIAALRRGLLAVRKRFYCFPYRATRLFGQAHFCVGVKGPGPELR